MTTQPHKKPHLTPKHLVGIERDRFYNRLLLIATFVIVLAVVGLVGWDAARHYLLLPRSTVAEVEDVKISGIQFQQRARVSRSQLVASYMQTYSQYMQMVQFFGNDPNFQQQIYGQLSQIAYQLDPKITGSTTINNMVDDELVKLEAEELGISISEAEIDKQIQAMLNYYPSGTPTSPPTSTPFAVSTLSETQQAIITITPTPSPFPTLTPTPSGLPTDTATPLPQESVTPTATFPPIPSATPYTAEGYQTALADYLSGIDKSLGLSEQDLRDLVRGDLLRNAVFEKVTADVPHDEVQVWARHILVADETTAREVLDKLHNGEDWNALASQYSTDTGSKDNGGDLGWFNANTMVKEFSTAAFLMEIGQISSPVQTQFGWHIIQVLGHEVRPLSDAEYRQARQLKFQEFMTGLRDKYTWKIYDTWMDLVPTQPDIPAEYKLQ